jgi:hypothetical protein
LLNRFGCDAKLAQALGRGPSSKREVEAAMVVFVLPVAELLGELGRVPKDHAPVELVFVRPMAALDLSIGRRCTSGRRRLLHSTRSTEPSIE